MYYILLILHIAYFNLLILQIVLGSNLAVGQKRVSKQELYTTSKKAKQQNATAVVKQIRFG